MLVGALDSDNYQFNRECVNKVAFSWLTRLHTSLTNLSTCYGCAAWVGCPRASAYRNRLAMRPGARAKWAMSAKPLAELIDDCIAPALAAQGFAGRAIVSLWPEIVGERLGARSRPLKIDWPRRRPAPGEATEPATLVVRVEGAFALEMRAARPLVIERAQYASRLAPPSASWCSSRACRRARSAEAGAGARCRRGRARRGTGLADRR